MRNEMFAFPSRTKSFYIYYAICIELCYYIYTIEFSVVYIITTARKVKEILYVQYKDR